MLYLGVFHSAISFLLLNVLSADNVTICDEKFEHDASIPGYISSPFYGEREYSKGGVVCSCQIKAPKGYRIKLTFIDLDIEPSMLCEPDFIGILCGKTKYSDNFEISKNSSNSGDSSNPISLNKFSNPRENNAYHGFSEDSGVEDHRILGTFCGSDIPLPIITEEEENIVEISFKTDNMVSNKRFLLHYEASPNFTTVCDPDNLQCRNRKCYKSYQKCDNVDDCGDGTDEEDCEKSIDKFPNNCGSQEYITTFIRTQEDNRIMSADKVILNRWPWQVSLQVPDIESSGHYCSGTLINAQWVVTAAHCVSYYPGDYPIGEVRIRLGIHDLFKETQHLLTRWSTKVISYPDLEGADRARFNISDDIALIKLNTPVQFSKTIQPACLPKFRNMTENGMICYTTGWNETYGTDSMGILQQLGLYVQPVSECSKANINIDSEKSICVKKPGNLPCLGDSGGPLNCKIGDKWYVSGITSYGPENIDESPCADPENFAVYSSTGNKAEWIKTIINKYS